MRDKALILWIVIFSLTCCSQDPGGNGSYDKNLTIFFINDPHGRLENLAKIDHIVDAEKKEAEVILACSGDIFSGNPVVDHYAEKGYPIIDLMNKVGFDISAVGNHEYDYGQSILADRMNQADFEWICANVDMGSTVVPEPHEYLTINTKELKLTFLSLVETGGSKKSTIPSTHPLKVEGMSFEKPENAIDRYSDVKEKENSDLYIALTHLGHNGWDSFLGDFQLAEDYPFFDLIIGGHSHRMIDTIVNNIPIFQAGAYLRFLGKIELSVTDREIKWINYELIDLDSYNHVDTELEVLIDEYNDSPYLQEVVGYSQIYHEEYQVACFYADAMKTIMNVDVAFQNSGGVRSYLDQGDITKQEIYEIAPFNNGTVIYNMSVSEIKAFLKGSGSGFYYSGILVEQAGTGVQIKDMNGTILPDDKILSVGINDYIPAVHEEYFSMKGEIQSLTTAETLIAYLQTINDQVNYPVCNRYFRYQ